MPFTPPPFVGKLPFDPPDSISIADFMLDETWGRHPLGYSRNPFTCGLTGTSYSFLEVKERVDFLARAIADEMSWSPNKGNEWDKVVAVFSVNTIDYNPLAWAVHRLGGIVTPANAAYSVDEVAYQLKDSGAKCMFTCITHLETSLAAAKKVGLPKEKIFLMEIPEVAAGGLKTPKDHKLLNGFVKRGESLPRLETLSFSGGEGARRTAFLCYSSGTSGLPKGVMIAHQNVIANTLQICTYDAPSRERYKKPHEQHYMENVLGLLPMSHIYGLVVICHASVYTGDTVVVLPKFEMKSFLSAIQTYRINMLMLVPPIIIQMTKNKNILDQYDLDCVYGLFTGAAPLGKEVAEDLNKLYPKWAIKQGYGLTETCTVVCGTSVDDIWLGSSGCLIPSIKVRIVTPEGVDVEGYDQPGELLVKSPSLVIGYLNNDKANKETFVEDGKGDRWMRTGDEAVIRKSPRGNEHVFIVDRIKELIKVKGHQVAPAELEAHLLTSDLVADCAVIPVPDDAAGEVPKAFVVKSNSIGLEESDRMVAREIQKHVEREKSRYKWLKGGVEFIDVIPKSPSAPPMSSHNPHDPANDRDDEEPDMLDADEAAEEVTENDGDVAMESDSDDGPMEPPEGMDYTGEQEEEINLINDSSAHFDGHKDSIFCIAQHPLIPRLVATGGGDDVGYVWLVPQEKEKPLLPRSYESDPQPVERKSEETLTKLDGHEDSIAAITFSAPDGKFLCTAGLDGKIRVWQNTAHNTPNVPSYQHLAEAREVEEINWISASPSSSHPNVIALGAGDGSVWVYEIHAEDKGNELQILQTYYQHTASCTQGSWSPDGSLLATVSEDESLCVWDIFGDAAAFTNGAQTVVSLTGQDERFRVEGGLYSVAIAPNGAFVAVGGAEGQVRVVSLPILSGSSSTTGAKGAGAKSKAGGGGKQSAAKSGGSAAGQILASLQAQGDSVETISFSSPPLTLMATGSVDGSIALFDTAHRFAVRRHIKEAHEGEAVIKVEFLSPTASANPRAVATPAAGAAGNWILTSCGNDGVVRRWDTRGGTAAAAQGAAGEWRGHRGGGEGGGVLGFVQGGGGRVVTAGDDGVALVFDTPIA
ncbi:acetyl-CoA synthetase-like protein [Aulographum hederae CBS 113979]|uniref:Acetyl-CoA synthetase-like protein n=1 Tax=Aulographum hederae CBS 113979 TaxID=1176131 RepID=A0A6G1GWK9_9PEZI|nr:acetyl-CoA synthetase-like protein [Aulographum hederae CBS 113979]